MVSQTSNEERIELIKNYVSGTDFSDIENRVRAALTGHQKIILDLTRVNQGVQTEFYGRLWASVRSVFPDEVEAVRQSRDRIRLVYLSKDARAYRQLQDTFGFLFTADFSYPHTD